MIRGLYLRAVIVIIFCVSISFANHNRNGFFIDCSGTNLIDAVSYGLNGNQNSMENITPAISLGYHRANTDKIRSGVGIQYIPGLNRVYLTDGDDAGSAGESPNSDDGQSLSKNSNFYGLSLIYYLSRKIGNFEFGVQSYYHLGFTLSDFIVGLKLGYHQSFRGIGVGINSFYGYTDMINFLDNNLMGDNAIEMNKFVYNIGLTVYIPLGDISN